MPRKEHKSIVDFMRERLPFLLKSSRQELDRLEEAHEKAIATLETSHGMALSDKEAAQKRIAELEEEIAHVRAELTAEQQEKLKRTR